MMISRMAGYTCTLSLSLALMMGCYPALNRTKKSSPSTAGVAPSTEAPSEFTGTPSGLKYKVLRQGSGKKPGSGDSVTVHYKGWLDNKTVFDSSYDRGEPATFGVQQVIPGWTEGLKLMSEGGMMEFEIPSELGYGARGAGKDIPPNSTLHFQVELLKVL
jgi:FKBP-type peptidyl-prolyl cis-trans isomerase